MRRAPPSWNYAVIKQLVEQQLSDVPLPTDWSSNYRSYIDRNYVAVQVIKSTYSVESYEEGKGSLEHQLSRFNLPRHRR